MAHHSQTLSFVDDSNRYLFGLTIGQTVGVVGVYLLIHNRFPTLLHGLGGLVAGVALWGLFRLSQGVRREPYAAQLGGYLLRRLLGPAKTKARPHVILEVDGYTRDALTEEEQDIRLIERLQRIIAGACPTGAVQIIVTNRAHDAGALVTQERAQQSPIGRAMGELADRKIARLAQRGLRETDLRYYLVLYEPTGWERSLFSRIPGLGFRDDDVTLLDDLVSETRKQLAAMGLAARRVARVEGALAPDPKGETATTVRLTDGRYAASFFMLAPPAQTDPGWLDALIGQPGPYAIALWAHGTDPNRERLRLAGRNRQTGLQLVQAASGLGGGMGEKSAQFSEAERAMMRLRQPGQGLLKTGLYLTFVGDTAAEARRKARRAMLVMKGPAAATPATGLGHQWPLAASTAPGRDGARAVWRMDAETIANTYPFNRANPSTRAGLLIGETARGELVRLDPTDESLRNSLVSIFGLSGMGKTVLMLKMIKEWLLRGGRVTVLDRTGHYAGLGQLCGAAIVTTADALRATPLATQMVVVDLRGNSFDADFRVAVDVRVQTVVAGPGGEMQHMFVLEEAWQLEYLDASFWVMDLAKRGRHWAGFVLWVTHDPEELIAHKQMTQMFSQSAIKIVFALVDTQGVASRLGSAMGLTPKEIALVKALRRGQCYVMRHNMLEGSVVRGAVDIVIDPDEEWLFQNDKRTWQYKTRQRAVEEQGGDLWTAVKQLSDSVPLARDEAAV